MDVHRRNPLGKLEQGACPVAVPGCAPRKSGGTRPPAAPGTPGKSSQATPRRRDRPAWTGRRIPGSRGTAPRTCGADCPGAGQCTGWAASPADSADQQRRAPVLPGQRIPGKQKAQQEQRQAGMRQAGRLPLQPGLFDQFLRPLLILEALEEPQDELTGGFVGLEQRRALLGGLLLPGRLAPHQPALHLVDFRRAEGVGRHPPAGH